MIVWADDESDFYDRRPFFGWDCKSSLLDRTFYEFFERNVVPSKAVDVIIAGVEFKACFSDERSTKSCCKIFIDKSLRRSKHLLDHD